MSFKFICCGSACSLALVCVKGDTAFLLPPSSQELGTPNEKIWPKYPEMPYVKKVSARTHTHNTHTHTHTLMLMQV